MINDTQIKSLMLKMKNATVEELVIEGYKAGATLEEMLYLLRIKEVMLLEVKR